MLKEVSIEIGGYPFTFSRRLEESDIPRHRDYIPFLVVSNPEQPEILFDKSEKTLQKLEDELGQDVLATGEAFMHWPSTAIDNISLSSQTDSTPPERKKWLEEILARINPAILSESVWLAVNQREFYAYPLPSDWYLKPSRPEIFPVSM